MRKMLRLSSTDLHAIVSRRVRGEADSDMAAVEAPRVPGAFSGSGEAGGIAGGNDAAVRKSISKLEEQLLFQIRASQLPEPLREHRFHETRRWRVDFAWPASRLVVEVEGGHWINGRHTRGSGFEADCEKYSEAALAGWRVIRVTGTHIKSGQALEWIKRGIK